MRIAPTNPPMHIEYVPTQRGHVALAFQVLGNGPPLVLIHGIAASGRWWKKNVEALAEHFRVYVIDLIGFGDSRGRNDGNRFVLNEAADILLTFMDRRCIDRASLMGHSMGGYIAIALAEKQPDRVERLVLVDAAALPIRRGATGHMLALSLSLPRLPVRFLPVLLMDSWRAGLRTIWKAGREVLSADIQDTVAHIWVPTLVIWGARDRIIPTDLGRQLAASLPGAELVVVEGAGHNPMWERPEVFNQAVLAFLRRT